METAIDSWQNRLFCMILPEHVFPVQNIKFTEILKQEAIVMQVRKVIDILITK